MFHTSGAHIPICPVALAHALAHCKDDTAKLCQSGLITTRRHETNTNNMPTWLAWTNIGISISIDTHIADGAHPAAKLTSTGQEPEAPMVPNQALILKRRSIGFTLWSNLFLCCIETQRDANVTRALTTHLFGVSIRANANPVGSLSTCVWCKRMY